MLETLSRAQLMDLYLALRAEYFELCVDAVEVDRASQRAFAMVELAQLERQKRQKAEMGPWGRAEFEGGQARILTVLDRALIRDLFGKAQEQ